MWQANRITILGCVCGVLSIGSPSFGAETVLQPGDVAAQFECPDDQGQSWLLREHLGKKLIVVYFFPSDFSFCCTRQAARFRDLACELAAEGAEVVGISGDAVSTHRLFKDVNGLNFSLLSDADGSVARKFGVPLRVGGKAMAKDADGKEFVDANGRAYETARSFTAARWTFILDQEGRVLHRDTAVSPVGDGQAVLAVLRKLNVK